MWLVEYSILLFVSALSKNDDATPDAASAAAKASTAAASAATPAAVRELEAVNFAFMLVRLVAS